MDVLHLVTMAKNLFRNEQSVESVPIVFSADPDAGADSVAGAPENGVSSTAEQLDETNFEQS